MRRIAVVTSRKYDRYHPDDTPLIHALPGVGLAPEACVWNDPGVDWSRFDAVLVRTPWDYYKRWGEFREWLDRVESAGVPVANPVPLLRWNADKHYLLALERAGVNVVPTRFVDGSDVAGAIDACGWGDVVVKPAVSGGARDTLRVRHGDRATLRERLGELGRRHELLVQPFVPEIASVGEWSLMFFGGDYSHAVLKRPRSGDFRVQNEHGGAHEHAEPGDGLVAQARAMLAALPELGFDECVYARVDGVVVDGRFALMELEALEPQLFLTGYPQAGLRFAHVLRDWVERRRAAL
jgi:glutathione synthase/RimK-type ligase-like ATP-grasp enzyme